MCSQLIDILYSKLEPSGSKGFEGLIKSLIEKLTGYNFYLASSGSQYGRDISSENINDSVIAIECKRYGKSKLNPRELLGEIVEVHSSIPSLDLWVLATSKEVSSQLYETLYQESISKGIIFEAISASGKYPSSLEILCSCSPDIVFEYINKKITTKERTILEKEFMKIKNDVSCSDELNKLKRKFSTIHMGYSQFTSYQNKTLLDNFNSEKESRNAFGQILNVSEIKEKLVKRKDTWEKINKWYSQWKENNNYLILLGEEGDGKTWTIASWLAENIRKSKDFPPVIFLSSKDLDTKEPKTILANALSSTHNIDKSFWLKKINNWFERDHIDKPLFIIIIDGINERHNHTFWRSVLEKFSVKPFNNKIGLIITSRTAYWERYLILDYINTKEYIIKPYNDEELSYALKLNNLSIDDIPNNLISMIRKPRYFDLMIKYYDRIPTIVEITPARLVYEDWKDRYNRKNIIELENETFQELIKQLAFKYKNDIKISSNQVANLFPATIENTTSLLNELITGGILQGKEYNYHIDDKILVLGFALLLVEQLNQECSNDKNLLDVIEELLEPYSGLDLKAEICESAVLHSFVTNNSDSIKENLLYVWISSQNISSKAEETFHAYFPNNEKTYIKLAEMIWKYKQNNPWAQKLMMNTFLNWKDQIVNKDEIRLAFERWLGFISLNGSVFQRCIKNQNMEIIHNKISERIGNQDISQEFVRYGDYQLNIIEDDGLLRLGRFALAIISYLPRKSFIHAIAIGSLAEAIMGDPDKYKLFSWVVNSSKSSVFNTVKEEVDKLLEINTKEAQQAAYRLLSYEGSQKSYELKSLFPDNLFKERKLLADKDLCSSFHKWKRENLNDCLCRDDLKLMFKVNKIKGFCIEPNLIFHEKFVNNLSIFLANFNMNNIRSSRFSTIDDQNLKDIEPIFCISLPNQLVEFICKLVSSLVEREGMELTQLSLYLLEHYLIYKSEQFENIFNVWKKLHDRRDKLNNEEKTSEMFLFKIVLLYLNYEKQLSYLIDRPKDFYDLLAYKPKFKKILDWDIIINKLNTTTDQEKIRRILWFISINYGDIPDIILNKIIKYIDHPYLEIRGFIFEILYKCKSSNSANILEDVNWKWGPENSFRENHWASLILCESDFSYSQIHYKIDPSYLGYAVSWRDNKTEDVLYYIQDIEQLININNGTNIDINQIPGIEVACDRKDDIKIMEYYNLNEDLSSKTINFYSKDEHWGGDTNRGNDFDLLDFDAIEEREKKQLEFIKNTVEKLKKGGKTWFVKRLNNNVFENIVKDNPQKVDEWLEPLFQGNPGAETKVLLNQSFYEAICEYLFKINPRVGIKLYKKLNSIGGLVFFKDKYTGIPLLDYSLFKSSSKIVKNEWSSYLENCKTDNDLLNLILMLEEEEIFSWLWDIINKDLKSGVLFYKARALAILGFLDDKKVKDILKNYCNSEPKTWLEHIATKSLDRFNKDIYAKHWFNKFLNEKDNIEAWRSFRLFLHCVDRRFWVWGNELEIDKKLNYMRYNYYYDNISRIKNSIKNNEKEYREYYLNHKVLETQVWPWI